MSQFHLLLTLFLLLSSSLAFQSDELFIDDEEFGLEGGLPDLAHIRSSQPPPNSPPPTTTTTTTRKRYSDSDLDSKIQFSLEHAFGDSDFSPAGTFTARLKTWNHGGQVPFLPFLFLPLYSLFGCPENFEFKGMEEFGMDLLKLLFYLLYIIFSRLFFNKEQSSWSGIDFYL
jgi:hypothetical protein